MTIMRIVGLALVLLLVGCATVAPQEPTTIGPSNITVSSGVNFLPPPRSPFTDLADIIDKLAKNPIFQIAQTDATDTLAWLETAPDAPKDALQQAQAKVCPTMVSLAIADFQAKAASYSALLRNLDTQAKSDFSTPYLILLGTKSRYSTAPAANPQTQFAQIKKDVYTRVSAVLNGCRMILPTERLVEVARIAGIDFATGGVAGILP